LTARLRERAYLRIAERIVADLLAAREFDVGPVLRSEHPRVAGVPRVAAGDVPEVAAQRSMLGKLNAVGPTKKTGCSVVRKDVRMSGIPLSLLYPKSFGMRLGPSLILPPCGIVAVPDMGVHERPVSTGREAPLT
jgi:hypothetical protein